MQHVKKLLKLQSISFASLSLSLFENLELHLIVELSFVLWHGSSVDESNVLRSMFGCQSGVDTVLGNHRFLPTSWNI